MARRDSTQQVSAAPFILRDYQQACLDAVLDAYFNRGVRRLLIAMATGVGKTVTFAAIAQALGIGNSRSVVAVVAHLKELLSQSKGTFERLMPGIFVGVEKAQQRAHHNAKLLLASIQTLKGDRLGTFLERHEDLFKMLIIDEAHRAAAPLYQELIAQFQAHCPNALILGATATPDGRTDEVGLAELFAEITYAYDLPDAVRNAYLVPIRAFRFETDVKIDGVPVLHGDFVRSALGKRVNTPERNRRIAEVYRANSPDLPGITYGVTLEHIHALAEAFNAVGIRAKPVWGTMRARDRDAVVQEFLRGRVQMLVNVNLFNEGFDVPGIKAVVLARPTKSGIVARQQTGRGMRPEKRVAEESLGPGTTVLQRSAAIARSNKPELILYDFCDVSKMHPLYSLDVLFSGKMDTEAKERKRKLPPEVITNAAQLAEAPSVDPTQSIEQEPADSAASAPAVTYGETRVLAVDLLEVKHQAQTAIEDAGFRWVHVREALLRLELPLQYVAVDAENRRLMAFYPAYIDARRNELEEPHKVAARAVGAAKLHQVRVQVEVEAFPGGWTARACQNGVWSEICTQPKIGLALRAAEAWVRRWYIPAIVTVLRKAAWRDKPPRPAQIAYLQDAGVAVPETRGACSDLIAVLMASEGYAKQTSGVR